jgi:hypothetical protein
MAGEAAERLKLRRSGQRAIDHVDGVLDESQQELAVITQGRTGSSP